MDLALHLPLLQLDETPLSLGRLQEAVDAARDCGFAAVSANDHFVFQAPWLDGPAALASVIGSSGDMTLATTVALSVVRGPVALAKTLAAIDLLSGGRLIAAVGPGSSPRDYDAAGISFEERWPRFDESVAVLRALLDGRPPPDDARFYPLPADFELLPRPRQARVPLWIGSWGSDAGMRRVRGLADGWLASAYNTTPAGFAAAREGLPAGFPNGLSTMWTWVASDGAKADRMLRDVLAPLLRRDPDDLRAQVCIGPPEHCAELLRAYADAGCERVFFWPLGDERRQIELLAGEVAPLI